ncbi:putative hydroxymethylpyrimidine transport system substrate-binding protein [Roseinatronobacter thiooxidans]|uniref:Putative hydroxymethylpyrimidine transport system substrate-binding protein n=1 Tax=Roseinatronobacter thiooxidans TaxID=121821 RepID=A0A2W7R4X1_9RHOB|nr:ABC transporter substrate-binding protein [Roseinatronobacter thiooxidans]PZX45685.1 putative hydroxymethylpyrimidine transport system substrate-binding protein [Roseinatronobacter thiooxidans]
MKHLFATTLLATTLALPAHAQDRLSVMLDWFVNPDHAPIILAQGLGYFTDAGLEVETVTPSDPNAPPRMAAAGRVDIAISYQPQLHLSRHNDLPLRRVGTLISTPLTCLVVLADGPVQEMADLRGGKVGFAVAGVQEVMLDAMLAHHGMVPGDVEQINIGWSISPALMSGQVDGVIGAFRNFELNQLAIEGTEGRCFYPESEGVPSYDELIYVANPDRMDADVIARFLDATERATGFILNNPDQAWQIFSAAASELQTELNTRAWGDTWPRFATRPAALDAGRYARFEAFLAERGATAGGLSVDALALDVTARAAK